MDALSPIAVAPADPADPRVQALIDRHLALMRATSPPESVFAQDAAGLARDGARLFAAFGPQDQGQGQTGAMLGIAQGQTGAMLGIGAYKMIAPDHAELKSMHVAAEARGRGIGRALLRHILAAAAAEGATRASLETGSGDAFAPALALYRQAGFTPCGPFGRYELNPFSSFLSRAL